MHAQGDPRTMQDNPRYDDVVLDVYDCLDARIAACEAGRHRRARGWSSTPASASARRCAHNLALLGSLEHLSRPGLRASCSAPRARASSAAHRRGAAADRLPGSLAAALLGAAQGVQLLRVHDVAATRQALAVWEAAQRA